MQLTQKAGEILSQLENSGSAFCAPDLGVKHLILLIPTLKKEVPIMEDEHIQIVAYQDRHADAFAKLNREWLDRFGLYEEADGKHLYSPLEFILDPGGKIFIAEKQGRVVGTCALIPVSEAVFEIAKLVVSKESRGEGLGRRLTQNVLAFARKRGAARVVLMSNHQLRPALKLYESLGFKNRPIPKGLPYKTVDIYMELEMAENHSDIVPEGA